MGYKAMAVMMSFVMVLAGVSIVSYDQAEASDLVEINPTESIALISGGYFILGVNEDNHQNYDRTIAWKIGETTVFSQTVESGTQGTATTANYVNSGVTIAVERGQSIGQFKFTVSGDGTIGTAEAPIKITYDITVKTVDSGDTGYALDTQEFTFNEIACLPSISSVSIGDTSFKVGISENRMLILNGDASMDYDSSILKKYVDAGVTFYATGLPGGLSMSSNGYVSGTPTESTSGTPKNANVYVTLGDNTKLCGTISITVSDKGTINFELTTSDGKVNPASGTPESVIMESNGTLQVKITDSVDNTQYKISWIDTADSQIKSETITSSGGSCTKDLSFTETGSGDGTGTYVVTITSEGKAPASFTVHVIKPAGKLQNAVVVTG